MRLILFFDLPVETSGEQKAYRSFMKNIRLCGFYMVQKSVYVKMVMDNQGADSIISKVKGFKPKVGNIMILSITEKQFSSIEIILGENKTDVINNDKRIITL